MISRFLLWFIFITFHICIIQARFNGNGEKVIGGVDTIPGEIPFQISLQYWKPNEQEEYNYVHGCGGSILNEWYVLTAAHCLAGKNPETIEVVAGDYNVLSHYESKEQRRKVQSVVWNPTYDSYTYEGDVGLIKVTEPFVFNEFVASVNLPPENYEPSGMCQTTGWGNVLNNGSSQVPDALQKVRISTMDRNLCAERYSNFLITKGMICAGETNKGACNGDSGGPLYCEDMSSGDDKYLAGSVSWGLIPCATENSPAVYANIAYYRDWINEVIGL